MKISDLGGTPKKPGGQKFDVCPEGTHIAVCFRVVDLGTQPVTGQYALNEKGEQKFVRRLSIFWEIPGETMADGRPFGVWESYTASFGEKAKLRSIVAAWLGGKIPPDFDTAQLIGKGCMLSVAHHVAANGNKYANVVGVLPLPKGFPTPAPTNEAFSFDLTDPINEKLFSKLSTRVQQMIKDSVEYKKMAGTS